jgi:hypothetical protein
LDNGMFRIITCNDLERAGLWNTGLCCAGCHGDSSFRGVEPDRRGRPERPRHLRIFAEVCCGVEDLSRRDFAKAVLAARKTYKGGL